MLPVHQDVRGVVRAARVRDAHEGVAHIRDVFDGRSAGVVRFLEEDAVFRRVVHVFLEEWSGRVRPVVELREVIQ